MAGAVSAAEWVWLSGALILWVPFARVAAASYRARDGSDVALCVFMGAVTAWAWPLTVAMGLVYIARGPLTRVFVGKPRPSRSDLEGRIRELEREVDL